MTKYKIHNIHIKRYITITQTNPKVKLNPAVTLAHGIVLKKATCSSSYR